MGIEPARHAGGPADGVAHPPAGADGDSRVARRRPPTDAANARRHAVAARRRRPSTHRVANADARNRGYPPTDGSCAANIRTNAHGLTRTNGSSDADAHRCAPTNGSSDGNARPDAHSAAAPIHRGRLPRLVCHRAPAGRCHRGRPDPA